MSNLVRDGDNLLQRVGKVVEELGHVKVEPNSGRAVLWLRDTRDVFAVGGGSFEATQQSKTPRGVPRRVCRRNCCITCG